MNDQRLSSMAKSSDPQIFTESIFLKHSDDAALRVIQNHKIHIPFI